MKSVRLEKDGLAPVKILAIDDDADMLSTFRTLFATRYAFSAAASAQEAFTFLKTTDVDLILLDMHLPDASGMDLLPQFRTMDRAPEVIIVTALQEIKLAIQAMKLGAYDYVMKPFETDELLSLVEKAFEKRTLRQENVTLQAITREPMAKPPFVGQSYPIRELLRLVDQIAPSDSTVLVTGESGTGKELIARMIHEQSPRKERPFITLNCAAVPEPLIESELFGHEKGAFTGAVERHLGKFELAHQGTLFLDEVASMPLTMQAKLLRAIQNKTVERVGGTKSLPVDIRIISATNLDLKQLVLEKKFREDLYYRLHVIPVEVIPLRRRPEDIPLLIQYFLDRFNVKFRKSVKGLVKEAERKMIRYPWPGNVRELENTMERLVALTREAWISEGLLPKEVQDSRHWGQFDQGFKQSRHTFEKEQIARALRENRWNQTKAAKQLGIHRTTFISKMQSYGIKRHP